MDYRTFEQRLLDTIFTTDVQLNPATIAFLYKVPVQEASDLLQQAAVQGLLNIESDDEGNILYTYPHRVRLLREGKRPEAGRLPATTTAMVPQRPSPHSLVAQGAQLAQLGPEPSDTPVALPQHIDMTEVASEPSPSAATAPPLGAALAGLAASPPYGQHASPGVGPAAAPIGGGSPGTMRCPFCSEVILVGAKKCKHCHEYLDYAMRDLHTRQQAMNLSPAASAIVPYQVQQQNQLQQWTSTSATQAALLSFFVPGLGQMCSGRVPAGLLWMMFTCLGYVCFIVPGIVLHILCVINAARQPRQL